MMNKKILSLVLIACLLFTGCGYNKPETHSMMGLNIKSITTICGTECTLKDIDVKSTHEYGMTSYVYTDVANDRGILDAQKYHDYLGGLSSCVRIDDFDKTKGYYNAYFQVTKKIKEGFLMKVSFTKDSYTVHIEDNANLEKLTLKKDN